MTQNLDLFFVKSVFFFLLIHIAKTNMTSNVKRMRPYCDTHAQIGIDLKYDHSRS